MKKFNIGVDIEDIQRFSDLDFQKDRSFFEKVYTREELSYCLSKANPLQHLAARFAGKEAVVKAIRGLGTEMDLHEIEIVNDESGAPNVSFRNGMASRIDMRISLSHCDDKAIAFAWGTVDET